MEEAFIDKKAVGKGKISELIFIFSFLFKTQYREKPALMTFGDTNTIDIAKENVRTASLTR